MPRGSRFRSVVCGANGVTYGNSCEARDCGQRYTDGKCGAGGRCGNLTAPPLPRTTASGRVTAPKPTGQSANPLPNIGTDDAGNIHCNSTTGTKARTHAPPNII